MSSSPANEYYPDFSSPPGETLRELLEWKKMSSADLASQLGVDEPFVTRLLVGGEMITESIATRFANIFDVPIGFWINRERNYRISLARAASTHSS